MGSVGQWMFQLFLSEQSFFSFMLTFFFSFSFSLFLFSFCFCFLFSWESNAPAKEFGGRIVFPLLFSQFYFILIYLYLYFIFLFEKIRKERKPRQKKIFYGQRKFTTRRERKERQKWIKLVSPNNPYYRPLFELFSLHYFHSKKTQQQPTTTNNNQRQQQQHDASLRRMPRKCYAHMHKMWRETLFFFFL